MTNLCAMAQNEIYSGINVAQNDDEDDVGQNTELSKSSFIQIKKITLKKPFNDDVKLLMFK